MRYQNAILGGYGAVALLALFFTDKSVEADQIHGACVFYMILLLTLMTIFVGLYLIAYFRAKRRNAVAVADD